MNAEDARTISEALDALGFSAPKWALIVAAALCGVRLVLWTLRGALRALALVALQFIETLTAVRRAGRSIRNGGPDVDSAEGEPQPSGAATATVPSAALRERRPSVVAGDPGGEPAGRGPSVHVGGS